MVYWSNTITDLHTYVSGTTPHVYYYPHETSCFVNRKVVIV
jgi:hypothetical protein